MLQRSHSHPDSTFEERLNEVAYTDDRIMVVHVEHFASQGANIPNWLGQNAHPRSRLGLLAREAVSLSMTG